MTGGVAWLGNSAAALLFSCRLGISTGGENQTRPCPRTVTTAATATAAVILGGNVLGVNHCVPADQQVGSRLICHVSIVVSLWHRVIIGFNAFWLISYLTLDHKLENKTAHRTAINCHTRPMIRIQIQLK